MQKRRRLWLGNGSCIRLRPTHRNHAWSYDVADHTAESRSFRMLTIVDQVTRKRLAIDVPRKLASDDALERLSDLFVRIGAPDHIRSDNGLEFTAKRGSSPLAYDARHPAPERSRDHRDFAICADARPQIF